MKFILFCDLLRAPVETDGNLPTIVGARIASAAVAPAVVGGTLENDQQVRTQLEQLFSGLRGRSIPAPDAPAFSTYLDDLAAAAAPLFPWIGGTLDFAFAWGEAPAKNPAHPDQGINAPTILPDSSPARISTAPIPLPPDYHIGNNALRYLLHAAISNLTSGAGGGPKHTSLFNNIAPFQLVGWDDAAKARKQIAEVDDGILNFRYEAFLAGLSSLPPPVPHGQLNLSRFTRITSLADASPGNLSLLIAAPVFKPRGSATDFTPNFSWGNPADVWQPIGNGGFAGVIQYANRFHGYPIEVRCKALVNPRAIAATPQSFVDRRTLWVARTHLTPAASDAEDIGVLFDDWLSKLPEKLADAFDLPRTLTRLIESDEAEKDAPIATALSVPKGRLGGAELITAAILLALRDTVGPGCIGFDPTGRVLKGPNGSPAHQTIIGLLQAIGVEAPKSRSASPDTWLELGKSIAAWDNDYRSPFRAASGAANPVAWFNILAEVLGAQLGLSTVGAAFLSELAKRIVVSEKGAGAFNPEPLRRVVNAATSPDNAAAIQIAVWRNAAAGTPELDSWLGKAQQGLAGLAERGFRLVETLRKANIDLPWIEDEGIWKVGGANVQDTDSLRANIEAALKAYLCGTLCLAGPSISGLELAYQQKHGRIGQLPFSPLDDFTVKLVRIAMNGIDQALPKREKGSDGYTIAGLSPEAHAISIQIDRLIVGAGGNLNEDLAGYGLLMRRKLPEGPWACLTSTFAEIDPDKAYSTAARRLEFAGPSARTVLGAVPVSYLGKMPQAIVSYDNRPVIGDDDPDQQIEEQETKPDPRLLRLLQPKAQDTPPPESMLPFLAYGAIYEIAPFALSNHGALPVALCGTDPLSNSYPAILRPETLLPLRPSYFGNRLPANVMRTFPYLRRTGVGSMQVTVEFTRASHERATAQREGRLFHPMFSPRETRLVAHEVIEDSIKTALLLTPPTNGTLKPTDVDFGYLELTIGAPLTSLEDFDRWIAFDELVERDAAIKQAIPDARRSLRDTQRALTGNLSDFENELRDAVRRGKPTRELKEKIAATTATLSLQDPAVAGLWVEATRVRRGGKQENTVAPPLLLDWKALKSVSHPLGRPRPSVTVECKLTTDPAKLLAQASGKATVFAMEGDVVIVRLYAAVPSGFFTDALLASGDTDRKRSFDFSVYGAKDREATMAGTTYCLFSCHSFAVEGACPRLPDLSLLGVIAAKVVTDRDRASDEEPQDIRIEFTRKQSVEMDAVGSVSVGSQAWRWTGRPFSPFPFHSFPDAKLSDLTSIPAPLASDHPLLWDIEGFAERLDDTLDDKRVAVPITEKRPSSPLPIRIGRFSPTRKALARYMRFRISAHNRYAAAYRAAGLSLKPQRARWINGKWSTDWFRVFRPALRPTSVPKPGIRALIPLTRALDPKSPENSDPIGGVLAIVDGAWYEHSGLSDWISAGVEVAYRNQPSPMSAAEFGPDPLLRTFGFGETIGETPVKSELRQAVPLEVIGPLGHTFDTGTTTGLYLNSSFIVRAPRLETSGPAASLIPGAWWMGKLNFRRLVLVEGTEEYQLVEGQKPVRAILSKPETPQASITLHRISDQAAGQQTITVTGKLGAGRERLTISLKKEDANSWRLTVLDPHVISAPSFDLRVVARRQLARINPADDNDARLYAWYEVLVFVRPRHQSWSLVGETRWFRPDHPAETAADALELNCEIPQGLVYETSRSNNVLQVSDATEGQWTQFLPNSETLARSAGLPMFNVRLRLDGRTLSIGTQTGGAVAWLATNDLLGTRAAGKTDQGLVNLLLVTRRIASVAGTEEEAYVGLCHAPSLPARGPISLEWFDTEPDDLGESRLVGRILTVRATKPTIEANDIAGWRLDPWEKFFPSKNEAEPVASDGSRVFGSARPRDASLQIIEIYAPIEVETVSLTSPIIA